MTPALRVTLWHTLHQEPNITCASGTEGGPGVALAGSGEQRLDHLRRDRCSDGAAEATGEVAQNDRTERRRQRVVGDLVRRRQATTNTSLTTSSAVAATTLRRA